MRNENEDKLRRTLHKGSEKVEPKSDGLDKIRARTAQKTTVKSKIANKLKGKKKD